MEILNIDDGFLESSGIREDGVDTSMSKGSSTGRDLPGWCASRIDHATTSVM